ncbi:sulfite exporter TauE/SafE family protein [Verrucomicrobiota bacterium sgz303538]
MITALLLGAGIGVSLGVLGGGGSIITLPVLVYAVGVPAVQAVGMSLAVVGTTSLVGGGLNLKRGLVHPKAAALFSSTGIIGALGGAQLTHLVSPAILLLLFAALMIVIATLMLLRSGKPKPKPGTVCHWPRCAATGLGVGVLTGFLGVGGGFLIVPAMVIFGRLATKTAIGTSLLVIAVNSFAGLIAHLQKTSFNWGVAGMFTAVALVGMLIGLQFASRVSGERLNRWFAWFVLAVAAFVVAQNWGALF